MHLFKDIKLQWRGPEKKTNHLAPWARSFARCCHPSSYSNSHNNSISLLHFTDENIKTQWGYTTCSRCLCQNWDLWFMSYSSWTHRDPSPPQPCFVAWDKLFCGVQPENSLMVSTVHKFQYQPKAWHSAKTQQTCLRPSQAESGLVSIWMEDSTISGGIDRCKTPKWWEGKVVLAQPWSVQSQSWALHIRGTATNRSFQRARKPEGNSFRK